MRNPSLAFKMSGRGIDGPFTPLVGNRQRSLGLELGGHADGLIEVHKRYDEKKRQRMRDRALPSTKDPQQKIGKSCWDAGLTTGYWAKDIGFEDFATERETAFQA